MDRLIAALCLLAAATAVSAVKPGENLLLNGRLEADQVDFPPFWKCGSASRPFVKWHPHGGPDGLPYLSLQGDKAPDLRIRQFGLNLVPDGKYRISMMVRTKGFSSGPITGVVLINSGLWTATKGIMKLPMDTGGKWQRVSDEFKCFASSNGYCALIRAFKARGELDVADIRLEAIDELALSRSGPSKFIECEQAPRLVPTYPKLSKIPSGDARVGFRFYGNLEVEDRACDVALTADGFDACVRRPLVREDIRLPLPAGATNGQIAVSVVERATGREFVRSRYNFRVIDASRAKASTRKRLNNLSSEVLSATIVPGATQAFTFALERDGWAFVAVSGGKCADLSVRIDGTEVIAPSTPRHETFRHLCAGDHTLEVSGAEGGRVTVREIVEILNYCPGVNSGVGENPPYGWEFNRRYVLPAVTTQLGGNVPKEHLKEFHDWGYRWMGNHNLTGGEADGMIKKLASSIGMCDEGRDGAACDEQNYADVPAIDLYAKGFWKYELERHPARPVYTWAYGKPESPAVCADFLAACINVSGGKGKLLREQYFGTRATEEEAREGLRIYVGDTVDAYRKVAPWAMDSIGIVYGNFNQVPILSLAHHPEVDYKYLLDMQLNYAANDPVCRGIGLIGYWGSYYADEELHRWSFALMRHYVVEGHTNMLSAVYGFQYNPGHVRNGDFRGSLDPWRTKGTVRADSHPRFAVRSQNRWGQNDGVGDTFAVLVRGGGEPAEISQTLKGLVPGRKYCLQFAAFDVKDVKANRLAPRRFAVNATLSDGAEIDRSLSWVHVDKRIKGRYEINNGVARINLHHVVFTAKAAEIELKIDNAAAAGGEELGINYVSVNPYFPR